MGLFLLFALVSLLIPPGEHILKDFEFSQVVYDRKGKILRVFLTSDDKYRVWQDVGQFPPTLIEALLLKEDRTFYSHPGFNPAALVRAAYHTYIKRDRKIGASTLTMQLVRLRDGLYTRNIPGKMLQILKAIRLDFHFAKQEILEAYLNLAPMGGNLEGFPAASLFYFDKRPWDLTFTEILFLSVIPQDPEDRSPRKGVVPLETLVYRQMLFEEWVKRHPLYSQWIPALGMPVQIHGHHPFEAPHATEYLAETLSDPKGEITSTLDGNLQNLLERQLTAFVRMYKELGVRNGAALLMNYKTMEVLAMVGSADYFNDEIHGQVRGFNAKRSPGSTLKPFIYGFALDQGLIHPSTMLKDAPTSFGTYTPDNFQSEFQGPVLAWEALVQSRNIPALHLANRIENPDLYDFLVSAEIEGLKEKDHYGLSIVLGSAEVTMLELARLYALLGNQGRYRKLRFNRYAPPEEDPPRLLSWESSYLVREMLNKNPSPLSHRPEDAKDVPIAFKTGTSIGFKDCWTVGIFDTYVLVVWMGNFDGRGDPIFNGRTTGAPLFFSIADALLLERQERLPKPPRPWGITQVDVCAVSGALPGEFCSRLTKTGFLPGVSPIRSCSIHREVYIDSRTGFRTHDKDSGYAERQIREFWTTDLLELFEKAGLPRLTPPPFPPDDPSFIQSGFPPRIQSPLNEGRYIIRRGTRHNFIPLMGVTDGDNDRLYWFADSSFLGTGGRTDFIEWKPDPKEYQVTAVDQMGRSSSVVIIVEDEDL